MKKVLHDLDGVHALWQDGDAFLSGTDAVLLAGAVSCRPDETGCELGTGCGMATLLLAIHKPFRRVYAVERAPDALALAAENFGMNGFADRLVPVAGDLRRVSLPEKCDFVFSNPPYRRRDQGRSENAARDGALFEGPGGVEAVCKAASALLRGKGRLYLIWPVERLAAVFSALEKTDLEAKEMIPVIPVRGRAAKWALLCARKGAKPGLTCRPAFVLKEKNGADTPEAARLFGAGVIEEEEA
ncbi:MAG: methyltransferase [Clostridia bacterium]|nr:methyltransferase [Clostridia bacterium]